MTGLEVRLPHDSQHPFHSNIDSPGFDGSVGVAPPWGGSSMKTLTDSIDNIWCHMFEVHAVIAKTVANHWFTLFPSVQKKVLDGAQSPVFGRFQEGDSGR
jgi:hypothetical protein